MKAVINDVASRPLDLNMGVISVRRLCLLKKQAPGFAVALIKQSQAVTYERYFLLSMAQKSGLFFFTNALAHSPSSSCWCCRLSLFFFLCYVCISSASLLFKCQIPWWCPWRCVRGVCSCFWVMCVMFVFEGVSEVSVRSIQGCIFCIMSMYMQAFSIVVQVYENISRLCFQFTSVHNNRQHTLEKNMWGRVSCFDC